MDITFYEKQLASDQKNELFIHRLSHVHKERLDTAHTIQRTIASNHFNNMKGYLCIALIISFTREISAESVIDSHVHLPQQRMRNQYLPTGRIPTGSTDGSKERIRDMIVGGSPADSQEYLSYAVTDPIDNSGGLCGATLIHPDILVSAAHCGVAGIFSNGVLMNIGATVIYGDDAIDRIEIVDRLIHPEYDPDSLGNDIMLIKLAYPSAAPVSTWNTDDAVPGINDALTIIGHGKTESGTASELLLEATVFAVDDDECVAAYAQSAGSIIDSDVVLCAVSDDSTTCSGDSGGPLFRAGVLVGVVSFGLVSEFDGSCISNFPSGFTRISAFPTFISESICSLSANPPESCFPSVVLPVPVPVPLPTAVPTEPPMITPTTQSPVVSISTNPPFEFSLSVTPVTSIPTNPPPSPWPSLKDSSNPSYMPSPIPTKQSNRPTALPTITPSDGLSILPTSAPSNEELRPSENVNNTASTVTAIEGEDRDFGSLQSRGYRNNCDAYNAVIMGVLLYGIALMHL